MSLIFKTAIGSILFALMLCVSSCSSVKIESYKDLKPEFNFEEFFSGELEAFGFFTNRSGKVVKQIYCLMKVTRDGDITTIDEDFRYPDGTTEKRVWKIKKISEGKYEGTAGDVVGIAKIKTSGFAFNMVYKLILNNDGSKIKVNMNDWMYRVSDNIVINKTKMSKFGIHLGDVTLTIKKKI